MVANRAAGWRLTWRGFFFKLTRMQAEQSAVAERPVKPGSKEEAELLIEAAERALPKAEGQAIRAAYEKARSAEVDPEAVNAAPA
jgi:hypothetical protein